ncbi:MAG: hypothetical protein GX455_10450 [Phycisphaerae bacterium]|nr:hypothetical protein [Phycisphaerae bacterium]
MYEAMKKSRRKLLGPRLGQTARSIWNRPSPDKKKVSDPSLLRQQQQPVAPQPLDLPKVTVLPKPVSIPKAVTPAQPKGPGKGKSHKEIAARIGWITAGIVVIVLAVFAGSGLFRSEPNAEPKTENPAQAADPEKSGKTTIEPKSHPVTDPQAVTPVKPKPTDPVIPAAADVVRDHVLVIATYMRSEDLEPVRDYFGQNGIGTEILKRGSYYYLVTKARYPNPRKPGSEGAVVLDKIKQFGAKYKAPKGFERFDNTPFQDAYGMKLKPE